MRAHSVGLVVFLCGAVAPDVVAEVQVRFGDSSARTGYWLDYWIARLR